MSVIKLFLNSGPISVVSLSNALSFVMIHLSNLSFDNLEMFS